MRSGSAMADFASVFIANADSQDISVLALDRGDGAVALRQTLAVGGLVMPTASMAL